MGLEVRCRREVCQVAPWKQNVTINMLHCQWKNETLNTRVHMSGYRIELIIP